ncbi:MAG: sensor histidine kinase [Micrococcales bacterium]|nr:sensor histidine kinase [Micrococcales bacterium]
MSEPDHARGRAQRAGGHDADEYLRADHGEPRRPPAAVTFWAPVVLAFIVQVPASIWIAAHGLLPGGRGLATVAIALVGPVALLGARRFPGPVVAVVSFAASADLFVTPSPGPPYLALAFAIVSAIVRGARVWAFVAVAVAWAGTIALAVAIGTPWQPGRVAGVTLGILIVLGVGEWIRTRRARWTAQREGWQRRQQSEVQAERVRIARELHDVLAHSLSQINVQAGVGLHLMERQPDKAAEALRSIKDTSKTALEEVRSVLGVLRAENGRDPDAPLVPEPDLGRLPGLAASLGENGIEVRLDDRIGAAPQAVQLALYRIVQEALTNVRRHSTARTVEVLLEERDSAYRLVVRDDGVPRRDADASETGGRGLLGMRERAELLGGHLGAGPVAGAGSRGFEVRADIPVRIREDA